MLEAERFEYLANFREGEMALISIMAIPESFQETATEESVNVRDYGIMPDRNVRHRIARDETLERIAFHYGVDRSAIVSRNKLSYPHIDSERTSEEAKDLGVYDYDVCYINETILIPTSDKTFPVNTVLSDDTGAQKEFGTDFYLHIDEDGDYDWKENNTESDVMYVYGLNAVTQSINVTFKTPLRRLLDFPFLGNPVVAGRKMDTFQVNMDRFGIRRAVLYDTRVGSVVVSQVSGGHGAYQYKFVAKLKNGQELEDYI